MIELEFNKNTLFKERKIFRFFSDNINKTLIDDDNNIILLFESENDNNVICLDKEGKDKWIIESYKYPNKTCPISNIYIKKKQLYVYRRCGIEEEISIINGKILSSELIK